MTKKNVSTEKINIRNLVLTALIEVLEQEAYSSIVIHRILENYQYLDKKDRAFFTRLVEGVIERKIELDFILNQFSSINVDKMKPVIRNILRMGVYQIRYMEQVPNHAACNEAVKLAEKKGFFRLKGFVNGVLRNIERNKVKYPEEEKNPVLFLSIYYSMPEWIVKQWLAIYSYSTVKHILSAFFEEKHTTIRCNLQKIEPENLYSQLEKKGIQVENGNYLPYALKIKGYNYLKQIELFQKGFFQVQDESSMLVTEIADIKKEDFILDVCAAPGGKSLHIAQKLSGKGIVLARDLTEQKIKLIEENIKRLNCSNIKIEVWDALFFDLTKKEKVDIVLADLPCSGLGVIGKKTDIKYKITPKIQEELVKLQRRILSIVSSYVKKNGLLIYSTCTINKEENEKNIGWFQNQFPFQLESIEPFLPEQLQKLSGEKGYLQLLPGIHKTDGFFMARLRKIS